MLTYYFITTEDPMTLLIHQCFAIVAGLIMIGCGGLLMCGGVNLIYLAVTAKRIWM